MNILNKVKSFSIESLANNSTVLLIFVYFLTFYRFANSGFLSSDDLEFYINSFKSFEEVFRYAKDYANGCGRFYFEFMMPIFYVILPYFIKNLVITKVLNFIVIFFGIHLFAKNTSKIFGLQNFTFIFHILFLSFINFKSQNNFFTVYPLYFSTSWVLFQFAIQKLVVFFEGNKIKNLLYSYLFFAFALLFYENYILFIFIPLVIVLFYTKLSILKSLKILSGYCVVVLLYVYFYFSFKNSHDHNNYDGVTMVAFNLTNFLSTCLQYVKGIVPFRVYFTQNYLYTELYQDFGGNKHSPFSPFINFNFILFSTSLLLAYFFYKKTSLIKSKESLPKSILIWSTVLFLPMVFIPQFLISLTVKYQKYGNMGLDYYITSYYSYIFLIALVTVLIIYLLKLHLLQTKAIVITLTIVVFYGSFLHGYSNYYASRDLKKASNFIENIEELAKQISYDDVHFYSNSISKSVSCLSYYPSNIDFGFYMNKVSDSKRFTYLKSDSIKKCFKIEYINENDFEGFTVDQMNNGEIQHRDLYLRSYNNKISLNLINESFVITKDTLKFEPNKKIAKLTLDPKYNKGNYYLSNF